MMYFRCPIVTKILQEFKNTAHEIRNLKIKICNPKVLTIWLVSLKKLLDVFATLLWNIFIYSEKFWSSTKLKRWFLVQIKAENVLYKNQKFFTPLKSFLPHFFYLEWSSMQNICQNLVFMWTLQSSKCGVKNFWGG